LGGETLSYSLASTWLKSIQMFSVAHCSLLYRASQLRHAFAYCNTVDSSMMSSICLALLYIENQYIS